MKPPAWPIKVVMNGVELKLHVDGSIEGNTKKFIEVVEAFNGEMGDYGPTFWLLLTAIRLQDMIGRPKEKPDDQERG
jgi:hypothetical protein